MFNNLPRKNRGQGKYMMDQKVFLEKSISKLNGRLETEKKRNRGLEMELLLIGFLAGKKSTCSEDLTEIRHMHMVDEKINFITNRIEFIKGIKPTQLMADDDNNKRSI